MRRYDAEQLKLVIDYCFVFSVPRGVCLVTSILVAKWLRRRYIRLPIPGSDRTILLRTNSSDIVIYNKIFVRREYDFAYLPHGARFHPAAEPTERHGRGTTIIDCGANVGC
jgi:hypothetical protein